MSDTVTNNNTMTIPRFMLLRAALVLGLGFITGYGVSTIQFSNQITDLKVKIVHLEDDYLDLLERQEAFENES